MSGWTDLRNGIEKILPYAATALGGPAGPAIGGLLSVALGTSNTPDAVQTAMTTDPNAQEKILGMELQIKQVVANQAVADHQADVAQVQAVNTTMQTEDANKVHWRNVFGYEFGAVFSLTVVACLVVMIWLPGSMQALTTALGLLGTLFSYAAAILGITAWHDGATKRLAAGDTTLSASIGQLFAGKGPSGPPNT